jgi:predicted CopG family antitoxin
MLTKNDLESNLIRIHEWIKSADQKVSIFLAFQGIILALLFINVFSWIIKNLIDFSCINLFLFILGIILVAYSIYKSLSAIIPRLNNGKKRKSIIYFGDIAKFDLDDFEKKVQEMSNNEYEKELIRQIHVSSKIAVQKHSQFRDSIFLFLLGMILLALCFLFFKI